MVTEWIVPFRKHVETIKNLPNRFNPFTQKGFTVYIIDDYAVHLMPEIRKALYERGYILILMGGGITGFIQANDTDREEEMNFMLKMLEADKSQIPSPSRDNMIKMLMSSWDAITTDFSQVFKKLANKLDGSEDYLVSDKLFSLIGNEMKDFRDSLLKYNLKTIVKQLIPPKGIKRNFEGSELLEYIDSLSDDKDENKSDEEIYQSGDDDDENESNDDESESAVNDEEIAQSSKNTSRSAKFKSLVNISSDPIINKDARFLEQIQALLLENDTSDVFKPHLKKNAGSLF